MGAEVARWLIAIGAVAAWTGIIVAGMGMSELVPSAELIQRGILVSVAGFVALIAGIVLYRGTIEADESSG
jgi:Ni,Fe-hydrogenase I small subunit